MTQRRDDDDETDDAGSRVDSAESLKRAAIERRAYEISQERGGDAGDPLSDWLQAEREIADEAE